MQQKVARRSSWIKRRSKMQRTLTKMREKEKEHRCNSIDRQLTREEIRRSRTINYPKRRRRRRKMPSLHELIDQWIPMKNGSKRNRMPNNTSSVSEHRCDHLCIDTSAIKTRFWWKMVRWRLRSTGRISEITSGIEMGGVSVVVIVLLGLSWVVTIALFSFSWVFFSRRWWPSLFCCSIRKHHDGSEIIAHWHSMVASIQVRSSDLAEVFHHEPLTSVDSSGGVQRKRCLIDFL